jgi:hypothetical protein
MSDYNFNNITIYDSNRGINISVGDSGSVQNINFTNIHIQTRLHTGDWWGQGEPIKITAIRGVPDSPLGIVKNIHFSNITCVGENAIVMYASDESKLENISFTNFEFVLRKSALEDIAGGNFDFRPNIIPGKSIFKSDIPIVYIENAENVYFNQGTMAWDGVEAPYYTYAVRGIKTKNVKLNNVISSPSPSNPHLEAIKLTE